MAEGYGKVDSVTVIKNHVSNRSKGCAFVKYSTREEAAAALKVRYTEQSGPMCTLNCLQCRAYNKNTSHGL